MSWSSPWKEVNCRCPTWPSLTWCHIPEWKSSPSRASFCREWIYYLLSAQFMQSMAKSHPTSLSRDLENCQKILHEDLSFLKTSASCRNPSILGLFGSPKATEPCSMSRYNQTHIHLACPTTRTSPPNWPWLSSQQNLMNGNFPSQQWKENRSFYSLQLDMMITKHLYQKPNFFVTHLRKLTIDDDEKRDPEMRMYSIGYSKPWWFFQPMFGPQNPWKMKLLIPKIMGYKL